MIGRNDCHPGFLIDRLMRKWFENVEFALLPSLFLFYGVVSCQSLLGKTL